MMTEMAHRHCRPDSSDDDLGYDEGQNTVYLNNRKQLFITPICFHQTHTGKLLPLICPLPWDQWNHQQYSVTSLVIYQAGWTVCLHSHGIHTRKSQNKGTCLMAM